MPNNADTGRTPLLMTRDRAASDRFVADLDPALAARLRVVLSPLLRIAPNGTTPEIGPADAVIFTSRHGVRCAPPGAGRTAFCVGPATTQAAHDAGWAAHRAGANADALVTKILQNPPDQRLIHLSGTHTRGDIVGRLRRAGLHAVHHVLYDQQLIPLTDEARHLLDGRTPVIVPLFSPRTAQHLARQAPDLSGAHVVALSQAVADALGHIGIASGTTAPEPDAAAMHYAIARVRDRLEGGEVAE